MRYETPVWRWEYWHNGADFYDLFGPTKRSRKGDAFLGEYNKALIFDDPRRLDLSILAAYFTGLDTLPVNQNVPSDFDEIVSGQVELDYTDTRSSQGSVDHEKGYRWDLAGNVDRAGGDTVSEVPRRLRFRLRASARELVRVAVQLRRRRERQPGQQSWRASTSADSATTMSMTARSSVTGITTASRASRSTRWPVAASARACWS